MPTVNEVFKCESLVKEASVKSTSTRLISVCVREREKRERETTYLSYQIPLYENRIPCKTIERPPHLTQSLPIYLALWGSEDHDMYNQWPTQYTKHC